MHGFKEEEEQPARRPRGIPADVLVWMKPIIEEHFDKYGSRKGRALLRADQRLRPWIGVDVGRNGETGDKRLDRLFADLKKERAQKAKRSARAQPVAQSRTQLQSPDLGAALHGGGTPNPLRLLGNAGAPSFDDLMADLTEQRDLLRRQVAEVERALHAHGAQPA